MTTNKESNNIIYFRYETNKNHEPELFKFILIKDTLAGAWVAPLEKPYNSRSLISDKSREQYAHPTKKKALEHYIKRTKIYLSALETNKTKAKKGIEIAKNLLKQGDY